MSALALYVPLGIGLQSCSVCCLYWRAPCLNNNEQVPEDIPSMRFKQHVIWGRRGSFILAATGSAVGLGNIWKFPYITGENGGGAFVLMYVVFVAVIGVPIMMAEILMGRRARANPIIATYELCEQAGVSKAWGGLGWLGVVAGMMILSFYTVIAGWTIEYALLGFEGKFSGLDGDGSNALFQALLADPARLMLWHTTFTLMTIVILALGVTRGLESSVRWMMPTLFVLIFVLLGYAYKEGDFITSLRFMFSFKVEDLSWEGAL